MNAHAEALHRRGACGDAVRFAARHETSGAAWDACERADWMLWILAKTAGGKRGSDARKRICLLACECARTALPYADDATRPATLACIETVEAWARGEAALKEVRAARRSAYADAYAHAAYAADAYANAAYAAADAAADAYAHAAWDAADHAADAAAYAAADAAAYAAADADAAAAAAAAYAAARSRAFRGMAAIVRRHYPEAPTLEETP